MSSSEHSVSKLHKNFRAFRDYLVTMVPLAVLSTYVYGWRVPLMLLISTVVSMSMDILVSLVSGKRYDVTELSSVTFAWTFTMLMPASVSFGVLIFGVIVIVLLGKYVFGGYGGYPFHPVAFSYALCAVSFPDEIYRYPASYQKASMLWNMKEDLHISPARMLLEGSAPRNSVMDLLTGNFEGPLGSTFAVVALSCMVLMIVHKAIDWRSPLSFMLTCAVWAFIFPRVLTGRLFSVLVELVCGGIPFAAAYLLAEPSLSPSNDRAKLLYGIATGILTMLITRFGVYEYGVCFALLLAGPTAARLDRLFTPKEQPEVQTEVTDEKE